MDYETSARILLDALSEDLELKDPSSVWMRFEKIEDKVRHRPSSLIVALIEDIYPEKKPLIYLTHNVNAMTVRQSKRYLSHNPTPTGMVTE